jgi:FMN phosphatase YigB (HAD superfamily)
MLRFGVECTSGLLTNMYVGMFNKIIERNLLPSIDWDVVIDSSIVGLKKPDIRIFKLAEKKSGASGKEIVFVDNNDKNIKTANILSWNTFLYDSANFRKSSEKLLSYFKNLNHF